MYQPLTIEQFQAAQKAGFTTDQIISHEQTRKQEQTPQPSKTEKVLTGIGQGLGQAAQSGIGAIKSIASTANNISGLGQKALGSLTGIKSKTASLPDKITTPTDSQKPGFVGGEIGQFFIPGGAEEQAANAVDKASLLEKAPQAIKTFSKLGAKALTSAGTNVALTAAQGGTEKDVKNAGLIGGGLSLISGAASKVLESLPETAWSNILKRTSTQVNKNPNLPTQAAETGLVGTKVSIVKQAGQQIQNLELKLDSVLQLTNGKVDGTKVASYLDGLKQTYANIPGEAHSVSVIESLQKEMANKGNLSNLDANQLKRDIYGLISKSYGKGSLEIPAKIEGQKILASGIKQELEKAVPEVKGINQQQGVYIQIKKAIERQLNNSEGKGVAGLHIGMHDLLTGAIGEMAGLSSGHPLLGVASVIGKKSVESTLTQSTMAKVADYFNKLSPTQKTLFYNGVKGLVTKSSSSSK